MPHTLIAQTVDNLINVFLVDIAQFSAVEGLGAEYLQNIFGALGTQHLVKGALGNLVIEIKHQRPCQIVAARTVIFFKAVNIQKAAQLTPRA